MKRILPFVLISLLTATRLSAQPPLTTIPMEGPVKNIVVNGHGVLLLGFTRDSASHISSRVPDRLSYKYTPDNGGTVTLDSGVASLRIIPTRTLSIKANGNASITLMPGDTLRTDKLVFLGHDYSNINIIRPINSDTLSARTFDHAVLSFDALEGFVVDLSDQGFSHINIDRRNIRIKRTPKKHRHIFDWFGL